MRPGFCISNQLTGDGDAAGPWTTLSVVKLSSTLILHGQRMIFRLGTDREELILTCRIGKHESEMRPKKLSRISFLFLKKKSV